MFAAKLLLVSAALAAAPLVTAGEARAARNIAVEEANRALVLEFFDRVFNRHDLAAGAKMLADDYRQHAAMTPDGKAAFVAAFTAFFKSNPDAKVQIVRSAADGDLVWIHGHATRSADDRGEALAEIFRVRNGVIVEHWNVIQAVPEKSANNNTLF